MARSGRQLTWQYYPVMFHLIPIVEDRFVLPSDLNSTLYTKLSHHSLAFILEKAQDMSQVMSLNYLDITYRV